MGGLSNAGWDLVFNFFGATTAAVLLACSAPRAEAAAGPEQASVSSRNQAAHEDVG